ncbi:MAG: FAD:protein FMN transferase [Bacteroidales bacterium]|nr:FAD:protein FMN transferase [Bacteroidales bacterium]
MIKFTGETQGTYYAITYYEKNGNNYQQQIDSLLKEFDKSVSLWVPLSVISRVNKNDTCVIADDVFIDIFNLSKIISEKTNGAFDITVGPIVNAWGFGFYDRLKVNQKVIDSLFPLINYKAVRLEKNKIIKENPEIQLDFNAIAQGFAVDIIGKYLESKGINNYLIDIGGEVLGKGKKDNGEYWKVGIEKPSENLSDERILKAIVKLENKAIATSGNYRKYIEEDGIRYSHTIDPKTGYPVKHSLLSVTVLSDNCASADAYATAFMVMGLDKAKQFLNNNKNLEAYFIYSEQNENLRIYATEGMEKILIE